MARVEAILIPELPETFWAYYAGFLDGEGSVTMCQNGPRMTITNTYLPVLEYFISSLGCGYLSENTNRAGKKQCYLLNYGSNAIRAILPRALPYMHEKKHRSEVLLRYLETVVPRGGNYHTNFDELRKKVKIEMGNGQGH